MKKCSEKEKQTIKLYGKQDIMTIFKCESDKALRILKIMFQMKLAIKIGKEYYVEEEKLKEFLNDFRGKEILI